MNENVRVQFLRGTSLENDAYTGPEGELTVDTDKKRVRIHDGTTQGGEVELVNKADLATKSNLGHVHDTSEIATGVFVPERIPAASTSAQGAVILADDLITPDGTKALTAAQGKLLQDTKAPKNSPNFTGVATADTPNITSSTTQLATTEFVKLVKDSLTINGIQFNGGYEITTPKWGTARVLTLSGDMDASASVDGSANVNLLVVLKDTGVAPGTYTKFTVDSKGRVLNGDVLVPTDIPNLDASKVTTGVVGLDRLPKAGTTSQGVVQLNDTLLSSSTTEALTANQGWVLKQTIDQSNAALQASIDNINVLLATNDTTLDQLQEIVDFIKANKQTLDSLTIDNIAGLQSALDTKVDKVVGKGLSTNDFTNVLLTKLNGIETGAQVNVPTDLSIAGTGDVKTVVSSTGVDATLPLASVSDAGIMSITDKAKLDSISPNANEYVHPTGDGYLHVPANETINNGKVLMSGANPGEIYWRQLTPSDSNSLPVDGTAKTADKLSAIRTFTFSGDVDGNGLYDGSSDLNISLAVKDDSHNHSIATVNGLQNILDLKLEFKGTLDSTTNLDNVINPGIYTWLTSVPVNAPFQYGTLIVTSDTSQPTQHVYGGLEGKQTFRRRNNGVWAIWNKSYDDTYHPLADKLTNAFNLSFGGDASGNVDIDGSGNVVLNLTVLDNSHFHDINTINGLQAALDSKLTVDVNGDVSVPNTTNTKDMVIDGKVQLAYDATTDSLNFNFI